MKKLLLLLSLTTLFVGVSATCGMAYDHDSRGWYDSHHHHHPYSYYHHHRGYWDQRNGVRVFINI